MIIGTGLINDEEMLIYRDTFGNTSSDYLEDSFLGPTLRAMPLRFFYQAISFPHHLYVESNEFKIGKDGSLNGIISVKTNRMTDSVDVDSVDVYIDGKLDIQGRARSMGNGQYRIWIPLNIEEADKIEIRVSKRYFADKAGNNSFGIQIIRSGNQWISNKDQLLPIQTTF